jgi:hypothetical protein
VQRLLRNKLYVDQYCTKQQLRIRHSKWELFRQLQAKGLHPVFDGEQVFYRGRACTCLLLAPTTLKEISGHLFGAPKMSTGAACRV